MWPYATRGSRFLGDISEISPSALEAEDFSANAVSIKLWLPEKLVAAMDELLAELAEANIELTRDGALADRTDGVFLPHPDIAFNRYGSGDLPGRGGPRGSCAMIRARWRVRARKRAFLMAHGSNFGVPTASVTDTEDGR